MEQNTTVIALSKKEMLALEMIVIDKDEGAALIFLKNLHGKIINSNVMGMKSHLDG